MQTNAVSVRPEGAAWERGTQSALYMYLNMLCTTVVSLVRGTIKKGGTVLKRRFSAVLASQGTTTAVVHFDPGAK